MPVQLSYKAIAETVILTRELHAITTYHSVVTAGQQNTKSTATHEHKAVQHNSIWRDNPDTLST